MKMRIWAVLLAVLMLAGCDQKAWFERFIPKDDVEFSQNFISLFPAHSFDAITAKLDPAQASGTTREQLERIASQFPGEAPLDVEVVGSQVTSRPQGTATHLTFQYHYPDKWLLVSVLLNKQGDSTLVAGLNVQPIRDSLENINRFTLDGKSLVHYLMLALAIAIPLFVIYALVLCIRTPMPRRKWLWVLFILFGFMNLNLNWTSGQMSFWPLYFQLLGAGLLRNSMVGPWLLSVSLPLGAIVFLARRKQWLAQKPVEQENEP